LVAPLRAQRAFGASLCALAVVAFAGGAARAQSFVPVSGVGLGDELTTLAISHRDPDFVLVGTATGQILRTLDGGATWQLVVVTPQRTVFYGRERQPDPSWEYAPGLPGKSPYLQSWLRRKGLATSGVNMAQLLSTKGEKYVAVNWIEVDWSDENRVFVGTSNGLYFSKDRARTFHRTFQGWADASERSVNTVATDPHDPRKVLLGTASGLFTSQDGGATFGKTMDYYMRDSYVREIWFDPAQKNLVHVALAGSAMASPNGGKNWITTHWHDWGPRADVQSFSLGPGNLRVIGTRDGLFASQQGGEMGTWRRAGERFVGVAVSKVLATSDPSVWYALSDQALWVTADGGQRWRKRFHFGGRESPKWLAAFRGERRHLWMLSSREIYRAGLPPAATRYNLAMRAAPSLLRVPELGRFLRRVLEHNRVYFADNQRARSRARWACLLPNVTAGLHYSPSRDFVNVRSFQYWWAPYTNLNYAYDGGWPPTLAAAPLTWEVTAKWDLASLIFTKQALPHWGRIERNLAGVRQELTERVHRLYPEYRRIARRLVYAPPANELARQYLEIRLQEIASYLDVVSGGIWSKATTATETTGGDS
jgi:photosystem II stability/assembly factor-like uncharacterized protein